MINPIVTNFIPLIWKVYLEITNLRKILNFVLKLTSITLVKNLKQFSCPI